MPNFENPPPSWIFGSSWACEERKKDRTGQDRTGKKMADDVAVVLDNVLFFGCSVWKYSG